MIALSAISITFFLFTFSTLPRNTRINNDFETNDISPTSDAKPKTGDISTGPETPLNGSLNLHVWRSICGSSVENIRKSWFFPQYPDEQKFINKFEYEDDTVDYGLRIFGYIHPPRSGFFLFGIASDDSSELWLSTSEYPKDKELIARVFDKDAIGWTQKDELDKYTDQVSTTSVKLERGKKYYIEVLHKQIGGAGFVQVFWKASDDFNFKLITSDYLSLYDNEISSITRQDAIHIVLSKRLHDSLQHKSANGTSLESFKFYTLPFIPNEKLYLPSCDYKSVFRSREKVHKYNGIKLIFESNVFPGDDTAMAVDGGDVWTRGNRQADKEIIESVVDKVMDSLELKHPKKYYLKRIHKVVQKPDPVYGDRYLVDLEMGMRQRQGSYRLAEHVYQEKGTNNLCSPKGIRWNRTATIHFVLPVKNQGVWVYHFINELTIASLLTGDTNFHVIVVDFESQDINMTRAFDTDLLRDRHTVINMTGKFYKTLALNTAVEHVPSEHDLIFLFDLHIDVPIDIMDAARKNTIEGYIAFFPAVGRLKCESSSIDHQGFWQMDGFGLLSVYKSDWLRFEGMNTEDFKHKWGGEDWDVLDRVLNVHLEVERIKYPGLYHHFHTKQRDWS